MTITFFRNKEEALAYKRRSIESTKDATLKTLIERSYIPVKVKFTCQKRVGVCGIRAYDRSEIRCSTVGYVWKFDRPSEMKMCGLRRAK